jgi:uncharacterized membrane protein
VNTALKKRLLAFYPPALLLLNVIVRSICLVSQDIALDEPFSVYHAQFDFPVIVQQLTGYNNPPLFELLLHVWIRLFGIAPLAVRTLPALFAALCPLVLYYFAKTNFSERVAVFSSLLLSFSTLLQFYAHDCRVYSLFLLLSLCSMHFFLRSLKRVQPWPVIAFIVFTTLLIFAHYFGIYIVFIQFTYLLLFHRQTLLKFTLACCAIFLLYSPQLVVLATRMSDSVSRGTWLKPPAGIENIYNMLWSFSNLPVVTVLCLTIFGAALAKTIMRSQSLSWNSPLSLVLICLCLLSWACSPYPSGCPCTLTDILFTRSPLTMCCWSWRLTTW